MPRFIIKLTKGDQSRYLEWSSVVDAPVTMGLTLEQFRVYYAHEYGLSDFNERLARVEVQGHSSIPRCDQGVETLEDFVSCNRAGPNETELDIDGLWEYYCKSQEEESLAS
jgi:hypothetical protein